MKRSLLRSRNTETMNTEKDEETDRQMEEHSVVIRNLKMSNRKILKI